MPDTPDAAPPPPASRDELIAMVARAHTGSSSTEGAGAALAAQSKLPKVIAQNLGEGLGQWKFFPEAAEIVDFAVGYAAPRSEEDVWALARTWAADDAAGRPTLMALVGLEILQHELRRIEVPKLRELVDEWRPARSLALRQALGLDVPAATPAGAGAAAKRASTKRTLAADKPAPAPPREIPTRMPKPTFVPPPKRGPEPPPRRFHHPKFGEGVLERQDGSGPDAKLTIKFDSGPKTLLARYTTELPG